MDLDHMKVNLYLGNQSTVEVFKVLDIERQEIIPL